MLPLHYGMQNKAAAESIVAVLQAYPDAAKQADKDGWLPLQRWGRLAAVVMGPGAVSLPSS